MQWKRDQIPETPFRQSSLFGKQPIIKCRLQLPGSGSGSGADADIADDDGAKATGIFQLQCSHPLSDNTPHADLAIIGR